MRLVIYVDTREGSAPCLPLLRAAGVPCTPLQIAFGDFLFEGKGPGGTTVQVGVELKTLADFIASIRNGRLTGHQLPGMRDLAFKPDTPGYRVKCDYIFVVVQGAWQANDRGQVCVFQGPKRGWQPAPGAMSASELHKRIIGLEIRAGVFVWPTARAADTIRYLRDLYRDWTDGPWEGHTSHLAPHQPASLTPLTPFQEGVIGWSHVGTKVAKAAERRFKTIQRAAAGTVPEWATLETKDTKGHARMVGAATATKIVAYLNGR